MNTTDMNNLRQFYSVVNRKYLNRDVYEALLKRWDLDNVDLEIEAEKIKNRLSTLTRSRREAVREFLILRSVLNEIEKANETENNESTEKIQEELQFN
jgi:hypothetical protein